MKVLETERLALRLLTIEDAAFAFELVNDPAWIAFIGDRGVRTLDDARNYLLNGPLAMYARMGFGMYCVERKADAIPIGTCGLVKRDFLEDVDIGFAFLPQFRGQGYALEAARATLDYAFTKLALGRIAAITVAENVHSIRLLEKLGLRLERTVKWPEDLSELSLYSMQSPAGAAPPPPA